MPRVLTMQRILQVGLTAAAAAALFFAAVQFLSSVILGLVALVVWFGGVSAFARSSPTRNAALTLLSIAVGWLALEAVLRLDAFNAAVYGSAAEFGHGLSGGIDPPFFEPDPQLGVRIIPDRRSRWIRLREGKLLFDVSMSSDGNGFRKLPPGSDDGAPVLFLGDSFNFGTGVNDDETSAFYLREYSKGAVLPINMSVSGYGIHQVLRELQLGRPQASGHRRFGRAILSIVDDHVLRAAGRSFWPQFSPRYALLPDGRVAYDGVFPSNTGFEPSSLAHRLAVGSRVFALARKTFTIFSTNDERLFVALLREIEATLTADYGTPLVVLYFSGRTWHGDLVGARSMMLPLLCEAGVAFIDVNAVLRGQIGDASQYYIAGDGHPTPRLNQLVGRLLADLADVGRPPAGSPECARRP